MSESQKRIEREILEKIYVRNRSSEKDITGKWKNWDFQRAPIEIMKEWNGVEVDKETGLIIKLDLSGRGLKEIPKSIDQLKSLKVLDLSNNCLKGKSKLV